MGREKRNNNMLIMTQVLVWAFVILMPAERFMRVHRSYIVSLGRIDSVSSGGDISIGNAFIHVSESFRPAFDAWLDARSLQSS